MATTGTVREDVVRTILTIDREFMDAVAAKDAERVAALYAEDARIVMPGRPTISGRSEIVSFCKAAFQGLVESIILDTTDIQVSGDLAYATASNQTGEARTMHCFPENCDSVWADQLISVRLMEDV